MDGLSQTSGIVALAGLALAIIAIALALGAFLSLRRLRAAQTLVLGEGDQRDLVAHAAQLQTTVAALHSYVAGVAEQLDARLGEIDERVKHAFAFRALVRYDAYNEMSGHQSLSIALLDESHSGIVLSSIHHRDQARLYAKQVTGGKSELALSPEEEDALSRALNPPTA